MAKTLQTLTPEEIIRVAPVLRLAMRLATLDERAAWVEFIELAQHEGFASDEIVEMIVARAATMKGTL